MPMPVTHLFVAATLAGLLLIHPPSASARLFRSDSGDLRLIGLRVELQANRGYCAPATLAGVMRYHGIDIDQHQIARDSGSSNDTGTDVEAMLRVIARSSDEHALTVETLIGFDYARYRRIMLRYNRLARRSGAKPLAFPDSGALDLSAVFSDADIGVLRKTVRGRDTRRFARNVQRAIEADSPLIWGVVLGIAPEPALAPYSRGGHLRLITGINPRTREILYTDPWGPGQAHKRMPIDDAFAITMSLHTLRRNTGRADF